MTTSLNQFPSFFAESCYQNFLAALLETNSIVKYYNLAGYTICLWFAGEAIASKLTLAFEHLVIEAPATSDLTICIWDSVSTHGKRIPLPKEINAYSPRGEIYGRCDEHIQTVIDRHTKTLNIFDKSRNRALYWINDANDLPWWCGGSPLQLILHWFMLERDLQLTHAGAVGYATGGVLLTGKGGSGKSTTALSCLKAGMFYVSEDYCLVSAGSQPYSYCVYNSAKLESHTLKLFPELSAYIANTDRGAQDKAFIYQHQHYPDKIIKGFPLKALLVLQVENSSHSTLEPISVMDALPALTVSTMWQLVHTGMRTLAHLKAVAEALPCYRLRLGKDMAQTTEIIAGLL